MLVVKWRSDSESVTTRFTSSVHRNGSNNSFIANVITLLETTGLLSVVEMFDTEREALASFRSSRPA